MRVYQKAQSPRSFSVTASSMSRDIPNKDVYHRFTLILDVLAENICQKAQRFGRQPSKCPVQIDSLLRLHGTIWVVDGRCASCRI